MQTHFTQFGRVELDPSRIPAVGQSRGRDAAFARELDASLERNANARAEQRRDAQAASAELDVVEAEPALEPETEPVLAPPVRADEPNASPVIAIAQAAPRAKDADTRTDVEEAPSPSHAEAAVAPRSVVESATPPKAASLQPVVVSTPAPQVPLHVPQVSAPLAAAATASPARSASGSVSLATDARTSRATPTQPTAGYRSLDPLALDRLEAARDSVLRQIAFTLQDGISEARIQLDPPELGGLDLQVIVDATGQTRLSVVAERPEIAALLTQHMPDLANTLAQQGLSIAHAEVKSRDGRPRGELFTDAVPRAPRRAHHGDEAIPRVPVTFTQSSGLDFWV